MGPMMPARMILLETYSEIQRKVKKETRMRMSTTRGLYQSIAKHCDA
jgi:hypothetical protein